MHGLDSGFQISSVHMLFFPPCPTSSKQKQSLVCVVSVDFLPKANMCFAGLITAAGQLLEMAPANGLIKAQRCSDHVKSQGFLFVFSETV